MTHPQPQCPPIAVTMGEPAGVGTEIIANAWKHFTQSSQKSLSDNSAPAFFLIDDPQRLKAMGLTIELITSAAQTRDIFSQGLPVLDVGHKTVASPGTIISDNAPAVIASIEMGVDLCLRGEASALVTNPIQKEALKSAGFEFPGHTEFLGHLTQHIDFGTRQRGPVMMLAGPDLRTIPATVHQSLASVSSSLSTDHIVRIATVTAQSLHHDFGIPKPRLAIAGLNPHAGENGQFGPEETTIIAPAIDALLHAGIDVSGPLPADTLFHEDARAHYDAAICMYHDQALIPVKALDFHHTVNVTLGLPIIRTSPDHGTALDIAGKNKANPQSLISAITLADQMARRKSTPS